MKHERKMILGINERKILKFLTEHEELSTMEIGSLVYGFPVKTGTKEDSSTYRSLRLLEKKGFVQSSHYMTWKKTEKKV